MRVGSCLTRGLGMLALALGVATSPSATAAVDVFLHLEGIPGESSDDGHKDWINLDSVQFNLRRALTAGAPEFTPLFLLKNLDRSSPLLMQHCVQGSVVPLVRLDVIKVAGERLRLYQITLRNVRVTSYSISGATDGAPRDEFALNFGRIDWVYTEYDVSGRPRGDVSAYWDLVRNVGGGGDVPLFQATGGRNATGQFDLSWGAVSGRTYRIMVSDSIDGGYTELQRVTSESNGPESVLLPIELGNRFFYLEEATP